MTAEQIRHRRNTRTIIWTALAVLAVSALIILADLPEPASAHSGSRQCRWVDAIPDPYKICQTVHDPSEHSPPPPADPPPKPRKRTKPPPEANPNNPNHNPGFVPPACRMDPACHRGGNPPPKTTTTSGGGGKTTTTSGGGGGSSATYCGNGVYITSGSCPRSTNPDRTTPNPRPTGTTTTTTTTTTTSTTTTTQPRCPNGEHYHETYKPSIYQYFWKSDICHEDHEPEACDPVWLQEYRTHDRDDPSVHVLVRVPPCGTDQPEPTGETCPPGYHYHAVPGECHPDHPPPPPACQPDRTVYYFLHVPELGPDAHRRAYPSEVVPPCPTTTTTTTTTARAVSLTCGVIPQSEIDRVKNEYGWVSRFPRKTIPPVFKGDHPPEGTTRLSLFVSSDKLGSAASAEPYIWPTYPAASTVTDEQGCVWEATTVRSAWRELHVWGSSSDYAAIRKLAPSLIERWNNMSTYVRDTIRTSHEHVKSAFPADCPVTTTDPKTDCRFYLPHPAVYEWELQVQFETSDGGDVETVWHPLHKGTSQLRRLIDYADWQRTNTN